MKYLPLLLQLVSLPILASRIPLQSYSSLDLPFNLKPFLADLYEPPKPKVQST